MQRVTLDPLFHLPDEGLDQGLDVSFGVGVQLHEGVELAGELLPLGFRKSGKNDGGLVDILGAELDLIGLHSVTPGVGKPHLCLKTQSYASLEVLKANGLGALS
jgi:hypothetical protein